MSHVLIVNNGNDVIDIIGNSSDVDPWLVVGRHHGESGSKEEVYNKRRLEGYFEMHFKRD